MRRPYIAIIFITVFLYSCTIVKPKDFTYLYTKEYTGIDSLIRTDGYYIFQRECDTAFHSAVMLYPDGLFAIATGTDLSIIAECFAGYTGNSAICKYPSWGIYKIAGDTIKTQTVRDEGIAMATIFRDYLILPDKSLINISDYIYPENTKIGYMANYPSFHENLCKEKAVFYPLQSKMDFSRCPYINKKWFIQK